MKRLLKMILICTVVFMMSSCTGNTIGNTLHTAESAAEEVWKPGDITSRKEEIYQLFLDNEYDRAIALIDDFRTIDDPLYKEHIGELKNLRRYFEALLLAEEGQLDEAKEAFQNGVSRTKIPKELKPHYDEMLSAFNKQYKIYYTELADVYAAAFHESIPAITSLLEQQKYEEAAGKVHEQYLNKLKDQYWYETGLIDEETRKLFLALHDYAYAMKYYLDEDYTLAYTSMHNKDASLLPASLQAQYTKDRETVMAAYQKYLLEWQRQQNSGYTPSNRKDDNGCRNDAYDVCDYSDPYEFWYWHPDDFYDFEDAEDYWQEHYRK